MLKGIVCQQLVPSVEGNLIPVFEIMKSTTAIQNMIREDKLHQLESAMQAGGAEGMCTMDGSLLKLYKEGRISREGGQAAEGRVRRSRPDGRRGGRTCRGRTAATRVRGRGWPR